MVTARLDLHRVATCRLPRLLAVVIMLAGLVYTLALVAGHHNKPLFDFKGGLYNAGTAILHGRNPYDAAFLAHQAAIFRAGGVALGSTAANPFSIPLYPAPANLAVVPLSTLPFWLAGTLFTIVSVGALVVGLRLLGVRDWRCVAIALLSWPTLFALDLGAAGPVLLLGTAMVWRSRHRLWPPAIALASIIVFKLFPWPLAGWMLVTRRLRALFLTFAIAGAGTVVAWATIGFAGMAQYPQMLSDMTLIQEPRAVSLVAVLLAAGIPAGAAKALALGASGAVLILARRIARRPDGDRCAFGLAMLAALTASPIVWEHYMVLLFVPIALVSPRLSPLWFVPLATPVLLVLSILVVPLSHAAAGSSGLTVRLALMWLSLEAVVGIWLCRRPAAHGAARFPSTVGLGVEPEPISGP